MRTLLDVNVLIALLDAEHLNHEMAGRWLRDDIRHGWASCPITRNGCVRVMAQPGHPGNLPVAVVAERLREATDTRHHRFRPDDASLSNADVVDGRRIAGAGQVTDVHLPALAVAHGGRFVTFDGRIAPSAVIGADERRLRTI